jgi:hypothetical protein
MAGKDKRRGVANAEYIAGMREIRKSNAAGSHDNRPKRERSRRDAERAAIRRGAW